MSVLEGGEGIARVAVRDEAKIVPGQEKKVEHCSINKRTSEEHSSSNENQSVGLCRPTLSEIKVLTRVPI